MSHPLLPSRLPPHVFCFSWGGGIIKWNLAKTFWLAKLLSLTPDTPIYVSNATRPPHPTPKHLWKLWAKHVFWMSCLSPSQTATLLAIKWQRPLLDQRQADFRYKNQCFQCSLLQRWARNMFPHVRFRDPHRRNKWRYGRNWSNKWFGKKLIQLMTICCGEFSVSSAHDE